MHLDTHLNALVKILALSAIDANFDIKIAGCHCL